MNINGDYMEQFTYDNEQEYWNAVATIKLLGVDYEADPDTLTIITDELGEVEYRRMINCNR